MRRAGWAAPLLAGAVGAWVLVITYIARWNDSGFVGGLTTLLPVPVAFACGVASRRWTGLTAVLWMAVTIELNQGYVNPFVLVITLGPWFAGAVIRDRRQMTQQLLEVGRELEAESERVADEAVRLERARIARELHDIVAHCVSVMVVQAYAGERLAQSDQVLATESFDHIAVAAAQAKLEIAHLVDLLADDQEARADRDLAANLHDLVANVRVTGLDISLHVTGRPEEMGLESAVVAYRVVQESITNALKHSPGAPIDISVDCGSEVVIDVVNTATHPTHSELAETGAGHGLNGIANRVSRLGGKFSAGPESQGQAGWRVSVRFPAVAGRAHS